MFPILDECLPSKWKELAKTNDDDDTQIVTNERTGKKLINKPNDPISIKSM